jgi:hypothetical protein
VETNLPVAPQYEKVRQRSCQLPHPLNAEGEPSRLSERRDYRATWGSKNLYKIKLALFLISPCRIVPPAKTLTL